VLFYEPHHLPPVNNWVCLVVHGAYMVSSVGLLAVTFLPAYAANCMLNTVALLYHSHGSGCDSIVLDMVKGNISPPRRSPPLATPPSTAAYLGEGFACFAGITTRCKRLLAGLLAATRRHLMPFSPLRGNASFYPTAAPL